MAALIFDVEALTQDLNKSITTGEAGSWIEGMDKSKVEEVLGGYQQKI